MPLPTRTRASLVQVLADAAEEDPTILGDLLQELSRRLTPFQLVEPLVLGRWVDSDETHSCRYLASVGGTGPHQLLHVTLTARGWVVREDAADHTDGPYEGLHAAQAAADTWALEQGYLLA